MIYDHRKHQLLHSTSLFKFYLGTLALFVEANYVVHLYEYVSNTVKVLDDRHIYVLFLNQ